MIVLRNKTFSAKTPKDIPALKDRVKLESNLAKKDIEKLCKEGQKLYEKYPNADEEGPFLCIKEDNGILSLNTWLSYNFNAKYELRGGTWYKVQGRKTDKTDLISDLVFELDLYRNDYIKTHDLEDVRYISDLIDLVGQFS